MCEPGDVNRDHSLDAIDYIIVKKLILGSVTLSKEQSKVADVDFSGETDSIDYLLIKCAVLDVIDLPKNIEKTN